MRTYDGDDVMSRCAIAHRLMVSRFSIGALITLGHAFELCAQHCQAQMLRRDAKGMLKVNGWTTVGSSGIFPAIVNRGRHSFQRAHGYSGAHYSCIFSRYLHPTVGAQLLWWVTWTFGAVRVPSRRQVGAGRVPNTMDDT